MNTTAKKRNIIITFLISLALMLSAVLGILFVSQSNNRVVAENYGTFNSTGYYYTSDGAVFYAVKVKTVVGTTTYATVTSSGDPVVYSFELNEITYTITNPTTLTYDIDKTIPITSSKYFTIAGVDYEFDNAVGSSPTKVYCVSTVSNIESTTEGEITTYSFELNGIEYTITNSTTLTYDTDKTIPITSSKYFTIAGVDYEFDNAVGSSPTKILYRNYNYWPTYQVVTEDLTPTDITDPETPVFIKLGETVLLEDGESILICFGRQTSTSDADDIYILDDGEVFSSPVDFFSNKITINGTEYTNNRVNVITSGGEQVQEFGAIISVRDDIITGEDEDNLLNIFDQTSNEGLIEYHSTYSTGTFDFMFYAFDKDTYQRTETRNDDDRPNTIIKTTDVLQAEYVVNSSVLYHSEAFYYFADQNLPYLEYDYTRYEIDISKTIHSTNSLYSLSYNPTTELVTQSISSNSSASGIYTQRLRMEQVLGTTKVRIYFSDLGIYDISYTAVYYNEDGSKTELTTLNEDTRKDRLTIYGTQATYQDVNAGQSPFRSEDLSADVTGKGFSLDGTTLTLGLTEDMIAASNQPPVSLLFNSTIGSCDVYYSPTLTGTYNKNVNYTYNSYLTAPGYYYIVVTNQYSNYKTWAEGGVTYPSETKTQVYFFQIKNQTPELQVYQLADDGLTPTSTRIYSGNYAKNGVQVLEAEAVSVFDSAVTLSIWYREFNSSDATMVSIDLANEQSLSTYEITKEGGYYILNGNGHYSVRLNFGKSGSTSCVFDIDKDPISGISVYNVESVAGSIYYRESLIAGQAEFATTNKPISLLWGEKDSKAEITASYIRFDLANNDYLTTLGAGHSYNDYILNYTWLAADYAIVLSGTNPKMEYNKASGSSFITSDSVLSQDGLYIFKIEDEAGNVAYYSVLIDTSIPTVLQTTAGGIVYNKVTGSNNVSEAQDIFFGSDKAIPFILNGQLISYESEGLDDLLNPAKEETYKLVFAEYFNAMIDFINGISISEDDSSIQEDSANQNYYVVVPIKKVIREVYGTDDSLNLSDSVINQGYHTLTPNRNDPLTSDPNDNGRIKDATYVYQIYDNSNLSNNPSRSYNVRVNTDKTGLAIYDENGNDITEKINGSKTAEGYTSIIKYYKPVSSNSLYLTWSQIDFSDLGFYVDLGDDGIICNYYPLVYSASLNSYIYSTEPTVINLNFDQLPSGIEINFLSGKTYAGKYEIIRTYKFVGSGTSESLGDDYTQVVTTVFVDRNKIITAPDTNGYQTGYYTYLTLFDGGNKSEYYNSLYQQSQSSDSYVIQTNKLPIGIYIPLSKYGTVYQMSSETLTSTVLNKASVQAGTLDYKFTDLVLISNLDTSAELGITPANNYYQPYKLTVTLVSPNGIIYYYSYNAENGYFMLEEYSTNSGNSRISIANPSAFINLTTNPGTGNNTWETGTYKLWVHSVQDTDESYLQSFYFNFNVTAPTPSYEISANYSNLDNMDSKQLLTDSNNFYTNIKSEDSLVFNWTESSSNYLTKVDLETIKYEIYSNTRRVETITVSSSNVSINGNERSFTISNIPSNITKIVVKMTYEVYSTDDTSNNYQKYYGAGYQSSKTIMIDPNAPTDSLTTLRNSDETVKDVNSSLLRSSSDSRFNKTIAAGIYKYYSYMSSKTFISTLITALSTNPATSTKYFYYRYFEDKYQTTTLSYNETGLGLDPTSNANNVFKEYSAINNGWTKVTGTSTIDVDTAFANGYYEFIEVDLAGNMTIYTIYLTTGNSLTLNYTRNEKVGDPETTDLTFAAGVNETETINSIDDFNLNHIKFVENSSYLSYKYLKISINNKFYLVTPFGYQTISEESVCTTVVDLLGNSFSLSDLVLSKDADAHSILMYDTCNKGSSNYTLRRLLVNVIDSEADITENNGVTIVSDSTVLAGLLNDSNAKTLALIVREKEGASLKLVPSSLVIYQICSDSTYHKFTINDEDLTDDGVLIETDTRYSGAENFNDYISYKVTSTSTGDVTYYLYLNYSSSFDTSTFYIAFKDTFGNEYFNPEEYQPAEFDDYEYDGNDLTNEMKESDNVLVSKDISLNFSNLLTPLVKVKLGENDHYTNSEDDFEGDPKEGYTKYQLSALSTEIGGYRGGLINYEIELYSNIPTAILSQLIEDYKYKSITTDSNSNVLKTVYVSIYNQTPIITITSNQGDDITDSLLNKEITQSEPITISFNSGNDLSENKEYTSNVYLRLRGSSEGYYQITSPMTVSEAGIYDIYIQNSDASGKVFDYIWSGDFVISGIDMIFYSVVKTNSLGQQEIVSPTGKIFSYTSGSSTLYVPYHYIVNTNEYQILTNGENVTCVEKEANLTGTKVFEIESRGATKFKTTIAVTVVPSTSNILGNGLMYYLGTTYTSPSDDSYIRIPSKVVYLCEDDINDEITLRWNSSYNTIYNKVTCYVSSDNGQTWTVVTGRVEETSTTLTLTKSCNYWFRFVDYAGNVQTFTSISGALSTSTNITFIRSVLYNINGQNPLDNSVYNGTVTVSLPAGTSSYYSSTPALVVLRDNVSYAPTSSNGSYVFTQSGTYVIYFSVKVKNGTKDLNEDKLTFTIVNPNDSRWAFNYTNYNSYTIDYIKYNGTKISSGLLAYAVSNNEINISSFLKDSFGNRYFSNGIYTVKITSVDDALGTQNFEFNFWLNDSTPPVTVSVPEGQTTTGKVTVSFNEQNLYETIGDCYVMVNDEVVSAIDSDSSQLQNVSLSNVRSYYIQVYTDSGKLVYSYRVTIAEPLNTITIILIVVASVVAVGGSLLFFLLRKRMKVR